MKKISLFFFWGVIGLLVGSALPVFSQNVPVNPDLLEGSWSAAWITCPDIETKAYGVFHFRKDFNLETVPERLVIHVSADNRYRLFINGKPIGRGPARGDLFNWYYESYDLASYLKEGKNVLAAQVWNMGEEAPVAQISNQTGFLVQGDGKEEEFLNTDGSWKVIKNEAYRPTSLNAGAFLQSYVAVGAHDEVDGTTYPWGWEEMEYDDSGWQPAVGVPTPVVPEGYGTDNRWTLVPRTIPQMEESEERIKEVRRAEGMTVTNAFLTGEDALVVPANKKVKILLDQDYETVGYPVLRTSGGKDASLKLTYAEALIGKDIRDKGNRNEIEGKKMVGLYDVFHFDGEKDRIYSPLWIRTWRYLEMEIETKEEPLVIEDFYGLYSTYPFEQKASFSSNDKSLQEIWDVGWRTARLCAGETYFDCPYYEQLQYEGDTRIQGLISLYNTGDDRLLRKAIHDFYLSRAPNGLSQGRYPSNRLQIIPPYSLFWVSMLYDYRMLVSDSAFIEPYLDAAAQILKWYENHIDEDYGMLGPMKWWNFVDWDDAFKNGTPDGSGDGHSSVITLQYAYTLNQAAKLFSSYGKNYLAGHYKELAEKLAKSTYEKCFNQGKKVMANQPDQQKYSQHASIMALLADAIPEEQQQEVMDNILNDPSLSQATFYFRFYLTKALIKSGNADMYYSRLTPWRDMLDLGLTTFAEKPDPTRSDCHAWSASPNYDFLSTICGIMPDAIGFKKVKIAPALGTLEEVDAHMPVPGKPDGQPISVHFKRVGEDGIEGSIELPENLTGRFIWKGKEIPLVGGKQEIAL